MEKDIQCKIAESLGVLSMNERGYSKEINFVIWNNSNAKLDIRQWWDDHKKCGKGITLTEDEGRKLMEVLINLYKDNGENK